MANYVWAISNIKMSVNCVPYRLYSYLKQNAEKNAEFLALFDHISRPQQRLDMSLKIIFFILTHLGDPKRQITSVIVFIFFIF